MSTISELQAKVNDLKAQYDNFGRIQNNGGDGHNPYEKPMLDAVSSLHSARIDDYAARWPEIKARWNAAVAKYTGPKGVSAADLPKIEAEAGISRADVQAVKAKVEG
jgi:hypothetical protein